MAPFSAINATNNPEPMHVSYSNDKVYVGDRANNAVSVMNPEAEDLTEPAAIFSNVCQGSIVHRWSNDEKLVIACDNNNNITEIL
jgi:hypothetical protein